MGVILNLVHVPSKDSATQVVRDLSEEANLSPADERPSWSPRHAPRTRRSNNRLQGKPDADTALEPADGRYRKSVLASLFHLIAIGRTDVWVLVIVHPSLYCVVGISKLDEVKPSNPLTRVATLPNPLFSAWAFLDSVQRRSEPFLRGAVCVGIRLVHALECLLHCLDVLSLTFRRTIDR